MKKNYTIVTALLFLLSISNSFAQKNVEAKDSFIKATSAKLTTGVNSDRIQFIKFPVGKPLELKGSSLKEKSLNFLNENKSIYGLQSIEKSLIFETENVDQYGLKNVVFKQHHKGVPVYDGELRLHFDFQDKMTSASGNVFPYIKLNATPSLSKGDVETIAIEALKTQNLNMSGKPLEVKENELFVFKKGLVQRTSGDYHLTYRIEISNELDVREFLFIDAHDGSVVEQFTGIAHAIDRIVYETSVSDNNIRWKEGDSFPGFLDATQQAVVVSSGHVYNFFKNAFGYVSFDNNDGQMITVVNGENVAPEGVCGNATWNGTLASFCDGGASDDITAHEWGHAYTQYTANLIYAYQSGAINESYSDIWGETVDLLNGYEDEGENLSVRTGSNDCNSGNVRWKIGEDASAFGVSIRDMWDPTCFSNPGKSTDSEEYNCSSSDNGGVHGNSGIPNHAYALLVDGGTYNGQTITPLGFTKAAHIFWRVLSVYLTPTSDFISLADALEASTSDLMGINLEGLSLTATPAGASGEIITASDLEQVTKTIAAVELRGYPDQSACGFTAPTYPAAVPALCEASTNNRIFYEDWESGLRTWTVSQLPTNSLSWESRDWAIKENLPDARIGSGIYATNPINGDCDTDLENGIIRLQSPSITIPNVTTGDFHMSFDHYVNTEPDYDGGNIKYSIDGGSTWTLVPSAAYTTNPYNSIITSDNNNDNPIVGEVVFSGVTGGWGQSTIDLTSLGVTANSTLILRWEFASDGCNGSNFGWYLDDIVIYNCSAVLAVSQFDLLAQDVSVYPNPTSDMFTIRKLASLNLMKAEIFDINGRKLKEADLSEMFISQEIDIKDLTTGIYFVTITSDDAETTVKLIKQ